MSRGISSRRPVLRWGGGHDGSRVADRRIFGQDHQARRGMIMNRFVGCCCCCLCQPDQAGCSSLYHARVASTSAHCFLTCVLTVFLFGKGNTNLWHQHSLRRQSWIRRLLLRFAAPRSQSLNRYALLLLWQAEQCMAAISLHPKHYPLLVFEEAGFPHKIFTKLSCFDCVSCRTASWIYMRPCTTFCSRLRRRPAQNGRHGIRPSCPAAVRVAML